MRRALESARLVLANSAGIEARARALGAANTRVVHLGTDVPPTPLPQPPLPTILTVGHLVARKRHADVLRALWLLRDDHPDLRWVVVGDGPERPALEAMAAELGVERRVEFTGELPPDQVLAAGHRVRAPEHRRGVRRRLRRGDGGGHPGHRLPRRGRAGGDPRQRRRHPARRARRPGEPGRGAPAPARGRRPGGASSARRRARPSSARSRGRRAGARRSPPTRRRCGEARPLRHQPRAAVPRRRVRGAARARGRRVRADRRRRPPRRRRRARSRTCRSRSSGRASRTSRGWRATTARWSRASPGVSPRSPPTSAPAGRACRSCCGRRCGRTRRRSPTPPRTCRFATCTDTPTRSSPTGRMSPRMCAPRARRRPSSRPHRASITGIGTDQLPQFGAPRSRLRLSGESPGKKVLKCSFRPGVPRACQHSAPRWFWSAAVRSEPGPPPPARSCPKASARLPKYATSMRAATLSSYRRSRPATSASPGAWWSTKPSTRESP